MTDADDLILDIKAEMTALTEAQADILAIEIAASFTNGWQALPENAQRVPGLKERAIAQITAEQLGYIGAFNDEIGSTLETAVKGWVNDDLSYSEIKTNLKPFVNEVFGPDGKVVIDNVGKKRTIIEVEKDGKLRRVEKTITHKYTTNPDAYAEMLGQATSHNAFEAGRSAKYQDLGFGKWQYISVGDERTRAKHLALSGLVFEFGTDQSNMAEEVMREPRCRCRKLPFLDDPEFDLSDDVFEKQKADAGLRFDDDKKEWAVDEKNE
jgi:SPP1 gp7 family putative phage head morphogenesis protein